MRKSTIFQTKTVVLNLGSPKPQSFTEPQSHVLLVLCNVVDICFYGQAKMWFAEGLQFGGRGRVRQVTVG